jgi:hypothetical protein
VSILAAGRITELVFLIMFAAAIVYAMYSAKHGKLPTIRRLPALDTLDEVVGRATEMGRPLLYSTGGNLTDVETPQTIAAFTILDYVAHKSAKMGSKVLVAPRFALHIPIVTGVLQDAYLAEGKPELFKPEMVQYFSDQQFAFGQGVMGLIARERPASLVMVGAWWGESLLFLEAASIYGVMALGGTANTHQIPFIVLCTSSCLIGEEIFAAGAYLSKDPVSVGTVAAGDIARYVILALLVIGSILMTAGVRVLADLFKM